MWSFVVYVALFSLIVYLLVLLSRKGTISNRIFTGVETHAIIVMNDEVTPITVVVETLLQVLELPQKEIVELMTRIHSEGIAIVWTGGSKVAENHARMINEAGLRCFVTDIDLS
ncbi:MAG: ATP-dependent Clp protease adaptor ClpS [Thermosynechococcaceae cyanobacterium]